MGVLAASRLPDWFNDLNSIIGVFGTLLGFGITFWQLMKTKKAAEAARDAANRTAEAARNNYAHFVISTCQRFVSEARIHVETGHFELAALRCDDLAGQFVLARNATPDAIEDADSLVKRLRDFAEAFRKVSKPPGKLSGAAIAKWARFLLELSGRIDHMHGPFAVIRDDVR